MRNLLFVALIALFFSCNKGAYPVDVDTTAKGGLVASWEYRGRTCHCVPEDPDDLKAGNGNVLTFLANGTYKQFNKTVVVKSGTYIVVADKLPTGEPVKRIIYDEETAYKTYFRIEGTKLTLFDDVPTAADGMERYYEKQ